MHEILKQILTVLPIPRLVSVPFTMIRTVCNFCTGLAHRLFHTAINALIGLFGLAVLFCVSYAVYGMLIKPWLK